jgi:hypothetical protein
VRDISAVVQQLRAVRTAERNFMGLWAVEQAIILPALDRVAADVAAISSPLGESNLYSTLTDCAADDDE